MWRRAALLLACLSLAVASMAAANPGAEDVHEAAVRATWSKLDAFWNARDAERFAALFTHDTSFHFVDRGEALEGRAAVLDHFAERFPRFAPEFRHRTAVQQVRAVAPDMRALDGKVEILRMDGGADAIPVLFRSFAIFALMQRNAEGWRISVLRVYELPMEET